MTNEDPGILRSIVLLDDDENFLHVLQRRLQAQRAEYATAGPVQIQAFLDPVEALVNLPAGGICVAIVDYSMPDGTGLEWLPKFLAAGLGPVILLTNRNDAALAAESFRAGVADFIAKTEIMTDDKRLPRAIREAVHRHRLEIRNRTLTRQFKLLNVELEGKNKRLKELAETAERFVDDVAHDFRTPLTVVDQYASLLADGISGSINDNQRSYLATITEATSELAEMVDDFLDSSKLRARSLPVDRKCHNVQELFSSVEEMLTVRAAPKHIVIDQNIKEGNLQFFGDLSKASRVLTNLAVNAIKASPEGKSVLLSAQATDDGNIRISVTDQGKGLSTEELQVIFDRFKQLGEPQVGGIKGFGLGLSIVKQLTWLNFGTVEVQSEPGTGSTFSFTLPAFDLPKIIASFLNTIQSLEEVGDLWVLRVRPRDSSSDIATIHRFISTFCRPMDLVIQDPKGDAVHVLGLSDHVEAWADHMRDEIARFRNSMGEQQVMELEIKSFGPWFREDERQKLQEELINVLTHKELSCPIKYC